jgi:hypothetical protein
MAMARLATAKAVVATVNAAHVAATAKPFRRANRVDSKDRHSMCRFFFVHPTPFSRYEKIFCVVKICAAWHNRRRCEMKNGIPHCET